MTGAFFRMASSRAVTGAADGAAGCAATWTMVPAARNTVHARRDRIDTGTFGVLRSAFGVDITLLHMTNVGELLAQLGAEVGVRDARSAPRRARAASCPCRLTAPYSVTTQCTWPRVVTTPAPGLQRGDDARHRAVRGRRRQRDDRLAARRERRAADEVHLPADAGVDAVADRVGADLAGEVDLERRVDRDDAGRSCG